MTPASTRCKARVKLHLNKTCNRCAIWAVNRGMNARHNSAYVLQHPPRTSAVVLSLAWHRAHNRQADPKATGVADKQSTLSNQASTHVTQHEADHLAALVQAAAVGDAKAFESFYHLTVRRAASFVRRIVSDNHCDDVLSDTYFQAWREAARFDAARSSALAWLLTLARSRALDRLRSEALRHGGLGGAPEATELAEEESPGPETLLGHLQRNTRLHAALATLSANERWVLGLAYYKDLSHSAIAEQTRLPLGTVKSLIHRAQQKLHDTLGRHETNTPHGAPALLQAL
jgi:RNA polymerase sigma-70 factor, ECF subfamily